MLWRTVCLFIIGRNVFRLDHWDYWRRIDGITTDRLVTRTTAAGRRRSLFPAFTRSTTVRWKPIENHFERKMFSKENGLRMFWSIWFSCRQLIGSSVCKGKHGAKKETFSLALKRKSEWSIASFHNCTRIGLPQRVWSTNLIKFDLSDENWWSNRLFLRFLLWSSINNWSADDV